MAAAVGAETGHTFSHVVYHSCYDGDTCTFTITDVHPLLGQRISVRIDGIDAPEIRGRCQAEKAAAYRVRDFVRDLLANAETIGRDVSELLLQEGLAVPYDGGTKEADWCAGHAAAGIESEPRAVPPDTTGARDTGLIIGNKRSRIYHLPGCPSYGKVSPENRVEFSTPDDAEAAGYRRAKNC